MEKNVSEFLDKCSKDVGKFEDDNFNQECFSYFYDTDIKSPIEQILYIALKTVMKLNFIEQAEPIEEMGKDYIMGLRIDPQYKIGCYKVDFLLTDYCRPGWDDFKNPKKMIQIIRKIIIECDSQKFHDRTEKERRYEKKRDRYLQSQGYKVFHYTGSEICGNALNIAAEIIAAVTMDNIENIQTAI